MRVHVISCDCGNRKPHVKFRKENGAMTGGIFSLARGRRILENLKNAEQMDADEVAETNKKLDLSGLSEYSAFSDLDISDMAIGILIAGRTVKNGDNIVAQNVLDGFVSPMEAERLRELIREYASGPIGDAPVPELVVWAL